MCLPLAFQGKIIESFFKGSNTPSKVGSSLRRMLYGYLTLAPLPPITQFQHPIPNILECIGGLSFRKKMYILEI